jgi:hypothetical protein
MERDGAVADVRLFRDWVIARRLRSVPRGPEAECVIGGKAVR